MLSNNFIWALGSSIIIIFSANVCLGFNETERQAGHKDGKVFSLFSIVTFKNAGCRSQSTMTSGQSTVRNGTCFTASECSNKGGAPSGNCASGFGVCCLFLVSATGSTINQNCTYLRNPGFPSAYGTTSSLSFTVNKCSSDVCYLRLDFETFTILGPASTAEATTATAGGTCPDQFKVTTNTGQLIPIICGSNAGQHIYVDIGTQATDTVTLAFTFSTTLASTTRSWELKVSQITCSNPSRPPNGCLQYFTTPTGRITTFNFIPTTSSKLDSQQYNICVRQNAGFCCVNYISCQNQLNSFTLDTTGTAIGAVDTSCINDFISIPGSSSSCSVSAGKLSTKYCGTYLGILGQSGAIAGTIGLICDCSAPFLVGIRTDAISQSAANPSRGVCLDYQLVPCTTN